MVSRHYTGVTFLFGRLEEELALEPGDLCRSKKLFALVCFCCLFKICLKWDIIIKQVPDTAAVFLGDFYSKPLYLCPHISEESTFFPV